jgi:hypothetical protein
MSLTSRFRKKSVPPDSVRRSTFFPGSHTMLWLIVASRPTRIAWLAPIWLPLIVEWSSQMANSSWSCWISSAETVLPVNDPCTLEPFREELPTWLAC